MTWIPSWYHINRSNLLLLESKAETQKRGQTSPDDGDVLALTFAQAVAPAEKEECDEDDEFGGHGGINGPGSWMRRAPWASRGAVTRRYHAGHCGGKYGSVDTCRGRHWRDSLGCTEPSEIVH